LNHPRLICISGWAGTSKAWDGVFDASPLTLPFEHVPWWDCLDEACGALGREIESSADPVVLLGWSLGAIISLDAAGRWPDRIRQLVLVSGTARMVGCDNWPGVDPRALRVMQARLPRDPDRVLRDFAQLCVEPRTDPDFVRDFVHHARTCPAGSLEGGLAYLAETDLRSAVAGIKTPTLLLHGNMDGVIPAAAATTLAELLPNAKLQSLDGFSHALPFVAKGQLAEAIKDFLHEHAA